MPNTFTKLYIHHISAVKFRNALIDPTFEARLYQYMAGTIKELVGPLRKVNIKAFGKYNLVLEFAHARLRLLKESPPA